MDQTQEKDILIKVKEGDSKAFELLFRKYHPYLVSIALSYTNDRDLSRDLSQEVFLDLWKRRKKIKIEYSLQAYLRKAVINLSMNAMKKKKRFNSLENAKQISSRRGINDIEFTELSAKVKELISSLPERCRKIFVLSRMEQKSHKEIALQLNISTKTIENQMTKALKVLRNGLKEADFISLFFLLSFITN